MRARTRARLRSLVGQGLDVKLVVDNWADQHFSGQLAAMDDNEMGQVDYKLRLLNPGSNLGFSGGVNLALRDADVQHCDAFLLINNDAVALPDMVARLAAALTDMDASVIAPTMLDDGKLFDEDFSMYCEGKLIGWRLASAGNILCYVKDAVVRHTCGGSSRQGQLFYIYHMARAHVLLALKSWRTTLEIPLLLVTKSIGLALRTLLRSARCGSIAPALASVLAWLPLKIRVP